MNELLCAEEKQSDLSLILDGFRIELNKLNENSSIILDKACMLMDFRPPTNESCEKPDRQPGILAQFKECLEGFKECNDTLFTTREGMGEIIG